MNVDSKLLEKYYNGYCSKTEQKAVEKWLASGKFDDNDTLNLPTNESKEDHKLKMWQNISMIMDKPSPKVIPIYKKVIKYAAVACTVIAIFFAGRLSTITNTVMGSQNNLLVYGGNGAHAKIPGNSFNLQFDGQLKLFNGSDAITTVTVGNKTYTLEPMQTYLLMGDNQKSSLVSGLNFEIEQGYLGQLKGDFAIKILNA